MLTVPLLRSESQASDVERERLSRADFSDAASLVGLPLTERWIISGLHQVCLSPLPCALTPVFYGSRRPIRFTPALGVPNRPCTGFVV